MEPKILCEMSTSVSLNEGMKEYKWSLLLTSQFDSYTLSVDVSDNKGTSKKTRLTYATKSDAVKAFNDYALRFSQLS